ncbi:unnamed protein product [Schistosoma curassoni]|uniref:Malectin_like domain-containing protein n=1 Tax=Schistosoma curassoni TaxID=6186 RepID=A0A183K6X7_9TREM|nr:unnamed protein product [Schistosoma curassoni]
MCFETLNIPEYVEAEELFRKIISILGLPNNSQNLASTTTGTNNDDSTSQTSRSSMYTTIDAVWDGQFPPKAPRPEDIIVVDESVNPPPVVTIEVPQEDQNFSISANASYVFFTHAIFSVNSTSANLIRFGATILATQSYYSIANIHLHTPSAAVLARVTLVGSNSL